MRLGWIGFCFLLMYQALFVNADSAFKIIPLGEYTSSPVVLDLAEAPQDATAAYYIRRIVDATVSAWEPLNEDFRQSATKMVFPATHGEQLQIRTAIMQGKTVDMLTLTDFDRTGSQLVMDFESSRQIFRCDYYIYSQDHFQGKYALGMRIRINHEMEVNDQDVAGFMMNDRIPTRDWTNFRYLEMYFWSDFPEQFTLLLQGEKELHQTPLMQFSQDGDEKGKWHFIRIDLDNVFPTPDERGYMRVCAITHPIKSLKMGSEYEVRFDALRLWRDDSSIEVQIDNTIPAPPTGLSHQLESGQMTWVWQPAQDQESGIAGYSYSWSKSSRDEPPDEIMTATPQISFPFAKPPVYSDYHFKVKAKNHAGTWSTIAKESVNYNPQKY